MKFNRKTFFDGFRERIDPTVSKEQVDGLEFILGRMENDPFWKHIPQIAYALATVFHETAGNFQPVEEGYYLGSARKVKAFQNKLRYAPYFGRGYVQLTWKRNYELAGKKFNVDLVGNPELALSADVSYKVLTYGMHQGWFTGKKLDDYIKGEKKDYVNARKIINGTDKAGLIAGYAKSFEKILNSAAAAPAVTHTEKPAAPSPAEDQGGSQSASVAPPPITQPTGPAPESIVAVQTPVVEVEQVKPEQEDAIDRTITKWSSRFVAVPAAFLSFLAGVWSWLTASDVRITLTLIIAGSVVAALYFGIRMIINSRDKARQDKLQAEREARAHELQILTLQSAMNKDLNTVRIVPQPIANSDNPANQEANA